MAWMDVFLDLKQPQFDLRRCERGEEESKEIPQWCLSLTSELKKLAPEVSVSSKHEWILQKYVSHTRLFPVWLFLPSIVRKFLS